MAKDLYQEITNRIIDELEKGRIPWLKPWTGTRNGAYSRATGRPYSLLNQFLLVKPGEYLTFEQAKKEGGNVRKGEKGHIVVFWKIFHKEEENGNGEKVEMSFPVLRYYTVFHVDQCDGISAKYTPETLPEIAADDDAEMIAADYIKRSGIGFEHVKGDEAYYSPARDTVVLPLKEQFAKTAEYYSTLFHEFTHSTGHKSRLNRLSADAHFGNEVYSQEELTAEIGAAACLNRLGMETESSFKNSAAYIQSWLKALKNDKKMIVYAAGRAEKAVSLIFGDAAKEAEQPKPETND